jgi:hypothetical protein
MKGSHPKRSSAKPYNPNSPTCGIMKSPLTNMNPSGGAFFNSLLDSASFYNVMLRKSLINNPFAI